MESEFDKFAAAGYAELLRDPIRDKFAANSLFFARRKLRVICDFLRRQGRDPKSLSWLDVGCGEGALLSLGRSQFGEVAGCDVSSGMLERCGDLNVRQQESPLRIPFPTECFDLVTAVCVYHHVPRADRADLTADATRVLKRGGILCIVEHNPLNPVTRLIVRRTPVDIGAELLRSSTASRLARAAGMSILETRYFLYVPERFYTSLAAVEEKLAHLPFGGQYATFSRK